MKGITKAIKQAIKRSLRCRTCPYDYHNCTPAISRACSDSFKDGFKKGAVWAEKQLKNIMNDIDLCSGLFCPLKNTCWRCLHRPKYELLWWVDPAYNEKTKKCKLYLKERKQ